MLELERNRHLEWPIDVPRHAFSKRDTSMVDEFFPHFKLNFNELVERSCGGIVLPPGPEEITLIWEKSRNGVEAQSAYICKTKLGQSLMEVKTKVVAARLEKQRKKAEKKKQDAEKRKADAALKKSAPKPKAKRQRSPSPAPAGVARVPSGRVVKRLTKLDIYLERGARK